MLTVKLLLDHTLCKPDLALSTDCAACKSVCMVMGVFSEICFEGGLVLLDSSGFHTGYNDKGKEKCTT